MLTKFMLHGTGPLHVYSRAFENNHLTTYNYSFLLNKRTFAYKFIVLIHIMDISNKKASLSPK